jgi:signal transduction histidine kinase
VIGVLSIYRDPHELNRTIRQGLYLLWTIIGAAGLVLFVALYTLFKLVYSRQKSAESKFSKLTVEHERIVQIEKMSAMGELVANIAHQLNNPLVGVINLTQLAERQLKDPNRVSELLAEVRKAGAECRDIVHRILRISQISRSTLQPTDVKELVQDTITFCHQSIDRNQALEFAAPEGKVMLDVDPVLIRQALFNLIHNAILAAPGKQVRVTLAAAEHERVTGVQLSVVDSGNGFGSDVAAKLFKPFFTTRSNGTGLGLSVAQHIAMKHGGVVLAENLPSGGARFSIWLPATTVV